MSKKITNLNRLIQIEIRNRILLCFALLSIVLICFTAIDLRDLSKEVSSNLSKKCGNLEDYIISEVLIQNEQAINLKIDQINKSDKNQFIQWVRNDSNYIKTGLTTKFPFYWTYVYKLREINGQTFGLFIANGSYLNNLIIKEFATRLFILGLFTLIVFVLLYPLSNKIPRELIFDPVNKLLTIFEQHDSHKIDINEKISKISEINEIQQKIGSLLNQAAENSRHIATAKLATQLAHDIRSPLAALKAIKEVSSQNFSIEQSKLFTMSIERITDIANTILPREKPQNQLENKNENCFLWIMITQLISEKRVQYKNIKDLEITFAYQGSIFSMNTFCNQIEFMRALSNIIDNSVEAKTKDKLLTIRLNLILDSEIILLTLVDNGKGIPARLITNVFDNSFTYGKKNGCGLGLFQVKKSVVEWDANIEIDSKENVGTKITIEFKKSKPPSWLVESINVDLHDQIFVLDDEEYVFQIIKDKFKGLGKTMQYFKYIEDFKLALLDNKEMNIFSFVDHDLKQEELGLDIINDLTIQKNSVLLTGNYDDRKIQMTSVQTGVKILPKPLIQNLPLII